MYAGVGPRAFVAPDAPRTAGRPALADGAGQRHRAGDVGNAYSARVVDADVETCPHRVEAAPGAIEHGAGAGGWKPIVTARRAFRERQLQRLLTSPLRQAAPLGAQQGVQYRNMKLQYVIKAPFFKDSASSFIHQIVDVIVYFARQYFEPNVRV